jgi:hypothetical protein
MKIVNQLIINGEMTIAEVESKFNLLFPFLSIEFFRKGESIEGNYRLRPLNSVARKKVLESFVIEPELTVHEVEEAFWLNMGLQAAIYRKVGNSILETSFTSGWTLEHQNKKGSELLIDFNSKSSDDLKV